ncbi:ABC transporter permease subunit [Halobellus sp. GM3]|uniref:ABC transporter permease subunit n=1 Tax=Halobellus sp. GM3 TaxID=3458410 RepID=UPI00403DC096
MADVSTIAEIGIVGLSTGFRLALLGAGITLVFGLGEVLNLSQGIFAVVAAVFAYELMASGPLLGLGLPLPLALVGAIIGIGLVALVIDRGLLSSVYRSEGDERILVGIFVTLGVALALEGILDLEYSYRFSLPIDLPTFRPGGLIVLGGDVLNIVVGAVILLALFLFLQRTYLGKATRTLTQNEVGAELCGVDTRRMRTLIFVVSALLAGSAGLLQVMSTNIAPASGFGLTTNGLIVAIVGGVRDVRGTVFAGIGLGLVLAFSNFFIGSSVALIILFLTATLVILFRKEALA